MSERHPATALPRSAIAAHTVRTLHAGRGVQSSVYLLDIEGCAVAVKDYAGAPRWFGMMVAPLLLRREWRALKALEGLACVPQVYSRPDAQSMAMQYIAGTPLDTFGRGELAPAVFGRVQAAIDAIHERGVAHCDLKRRSNLLLTDEGEIVLIDFAAAVVGRRALHPFANWLQREMARIDDKCVPRLKKFVAPELLTQQDRSKLDNPTPLEKLARKLLNR